MELPSTSEQPVIDDPAPREALEAMTIWVTPAFGEELAAVGALLSHAVPSGKTADVLLHVLRAQRKVLERRRHGSPRRKQKTASAEVKAPATENDRYIAAEVRRVVFEREGGSCAFVGEDGRRCGSRRWLDEVVDVLLVGRGLVVEVGVDRAQDHGAGAERRVEGDAALGGGGRVEGDARDGGEGQARERRQAVVAAVPGDRLREGVGEAQPLGQQAGLIDAAGARDADVDLLEQDQVRVEAGDDRGHLFERRVPRGVHVPGGHPQAPRGRGRDIARGEARDDQQALFHVWRRRRPVAARREREEPQTRPGAAHRQACADPPQRRNRALPLFSRHRRSSGPPPGSRA
jgi:hypothetical protein